MTVDFVKLHESKKAELLQQAQDLNIDDPTKLRKSDLVFAVAQAQATQPLGRGILEVHGEGFGFLRTPTNNFLPGPGDIYVSQSQIRRFRLRTGDTVIGQIRAPKEGERYPALLRVEAVNGDPPGLEAPSFDMLTAIYPDERLSLGGGAILSAVQRIAPMGFGQRGLLVAPARTGKVELLRALTETFVKDEELEITVLLLDERPEEIQEWRTNTTAEVIATPFDETAARHLQVADITFERARRMAERGDDVVLLVDSLTRLLRACLSELPPSGRTLSGVDSTALHRIRHYMGAARALEEGGSLTVIGVISGDTNGRAPQALMENLQEVVNWELTLSRDLADRGISPPIDVQRSGTRREERLLKEDELAELRKWRQGLTGDVFEDAQRLMKSVKS